nr:RloB family protein [uncultured Porphyromonas sp.]
MGTRNEGRGFSRDRQGGRLQKNVSFLIVSEDTKSSVLYFQDLIKEINSIRLATPKIASESKVKGCGKGEANLVREAERIREREQTSFDSCWLVFDKDADQNFAQTIKAAEKAGFKVAWSNESFELWYLLHFRNQSASIDRKACIANLEKELGKLDPSFSYAKGASAIFRYLTEERRRQAIRNAENLRAYWQESGTADCGQHNPCTQVDQLVQELTDPEKRKELIKRKS